MKKSLLLSLAFAFIAISSNGQEVKRYLTFEHFTNTLCGLCSSKNPAFFSKIDQYPNDVHHMSIHPPVPYTACVFYQHNVNDNAARANYYAVSGTPKVFLDGTATGSQMITDEQLNEALGKTSPIGIAVTETMGATREVTVDVLSFGDVPTANYKLYVAVVEKLVNYNAPNGEDEHHNVFRQYLAAGDSFTPAANGDGVTLTYNYSMDSDWVEDQMYVLAYLQNDDTKEILNSGTRFDEALPTSNKNLSPTTLDISVSPNPTDGLLLVDLKDNATQDATLSLIDMNGKIVWMTSSADPIQRIDLTGFVKGIYFVNVKSNEKTSIKKIIVQ